MRHPRRWGVRIASLAAVAAVLALAASASLARDDGRKHESWSWNGTLDHGTLEINGVNGEIVAEPGTGNQVEVTADKSGRRSDPSEVKIQVVKDSDGITICAVYPGEGNACEPGDHHSHTHNNDVEVNFHVRVPAGLTFSANTVNGGVKVHGLAGPVKAHTVNGGCDIETSSSGEASTVNGGVHARLGQVPASGKLDFSTVNGSITLLLPDDLSAEVDGSTVNGGIETDFPVTVSGKWGPRSMHGTIGKGGAKLSASTVNGSIHLERSRAQ